MPVVSRSAKEVFDTRVAASVQLSAWPVGSPVTDGSAEMACDGCTRHSVSSAGAVNVGFTVSATVIFCVWVAAVLPQLSFTVHTRSKL